MNTYITEFKMNIARVVHVIMHKYNQSFAPRWHKFPHAVNQLICNVKSHVIHEELLMGVTASSG